MGSLPEREELSHRAAAVGSARTSAPIKDLRRSSKYIARCRTIPSPILADCDYGRCSYA